MPLFVDPPSWLSAFAHSLGLAQEKNPLALPLSSPSAAQIRLAWAQSERSVVCSVTSREELWMLRPLALFVSAFGAPLRQGTYHSNLRTQGGLHASEWRTGQQGALLFVTNPTDSPCTGSVFPAFEERVFAAGETVIWAHDFPLGPSENYLGAYAGLVKSDAALLTAHIRPDPFSGARVFVMGTPGEKREVAVFNAGPGEVVEVVFGEQPAVFAAGISQIIAVPETLAPQLWLLESTTFIGPHWELTHAGEILAHVSDWQETIIIGDDEPCSAQLVFEEKTPEFVWLNGVPIGSSDVSLLPGENLLRVRGEHGSAYLIPDGACYQIELAF